MSGIRIHLCVLFIVIAAGTAKAQPDTLWSCLVGNLGAIYGATQLADGGFAVVGVDNPESNQQSVLAARLSSTGEVIWAQTYPYGGNSTYAQAVVEMEDRSWMVVGGRGTPTASYDVHLLWISETGSLISTHDYYSDGQTKGMDILRMPDGSLRVAGYCLQPSGGASDAWLLNLDAIGDTLGTHTYGGDGTDTGYRVVRRPDGSLWLGGNTRSSTVGPFDMWLVHTSADGEIISDRSYGTELNERCYALASTDSAIYLGGSANNPVDNDYTALLFKLDLNGDIRWTRTAPVTDGLSQIRGLVPLRDGGVICAGWASTGINELPWMAVYSPDGSLYEDHVDTSFTNGHYFGAIPAGNDQGSLLFGTVTLRDGSRHGYVMRMASLHGISGTVRRLTTGEPLADIRVRTLQNSNSALTDAQGRYMMGLAVGSYTLVASSACYAPDSAFIVTLPPDTTITTDFALGAARFRSDVTSVNMVVYNHVADSSGCVVRNVGDGLMSGRVRARTTLPRGNWLEVFPESLQVAAGDSFALTVVVRADTSDDHMHEFNGFLEFTVNQCPDSVIQMAVCADVLDAADRSAVLRDFALFNAYPNPFNPSTTISFAVPRTGPVRVTVFDVLGRQVATLQDGVTEAGPHSVHFDGANLGSGVYFVRMDAQGFAATRKIMLMK